MVAPWDNHGYHPNVTAVASAPAVDDVDLLGAQLVEAAAAVFGEKGYDRAGVAEIARRAGVTTGAIYSRYRSKAELLVEAVRVHCTGPLDDLLLDNGSRDTAAALDEAGAVIGSRGLGLGQALLLEAMVAARRDEELRDVLLTRMVERRAKLEGVIIAGQEAGSLDPALDTHAVVQLAHAIGLGFLLQDAVGIAAPQPDAWGALVHRLLGALTPPTADPSPAPGGADHGN